MTDNLCLCGCGGAAVIRGCTKTCYKRWQRNSFLPESGPLPPMSNADRGLRSGTARAPEPDPYELEWLADEPERRVRKVRAQVADLVRCVAMRDGSGVGRLLEKITDTEAAMIVLAECAEPHRTEIVCGARRPTLAAVPVPLRAEGQRPLERATAGSVALDAEGDADEAA